MMGALTISDGELDLRPRVRVRRTPREAGHTSAASTRCRVRSRVPTISRIRAGTFRPCPKVKKARALLSEFDARLEARVIRATRPDRAAFQEAAH